jgi:hypothetical protein
LKKRFFFLLSKIKQYIFFFNFYEVIEGPGIYYVGIIDILQEWNLSKKVERFFKTYFMNLEAAGISAIEPSNYQTRFMEKMVEITVIFFLPCVVSTFSRICFANGREFNQATS